MPISHQSNSQKLFFVNHMIQPFFLRHAKPRSKEALAQAARELQAAQEAAQAQQAALEQLGTEVIGSEDQWLVKLWPTDLANAFWTYEIHG